MKVRGTQPNLLMERISSESHWLLNLCLQVLLQKSISTYHLYISPLRSSGNKTIYGIGPTYQRTVGSCLLLQSHLHRISQRAGWGPSRFQPVAGQWPSLPICYWPPSGDPGWCSGTQTYSLHSRVQLGPGFCYLKGRRVSIIILSTSPASSHNKSLNTGDLPELLSRNTVMDSRWTAHFI